jgi:hypothetical protein
MAITPHIVSELRRAVADAWPTTIRFIDWAASSETPEETAVADLAKKLRLNTSDTKDLVDGIVELELASFIVGRRSHPSRLKWKFTLKSIAAVARGEANELVSIGQSTLARRSTAHDTIEHTFQLRPDFKTIVPLPADLSTDEARRFSAFILTLPFEK